MKVCEKCNREFEDSSLDFCPEDGARLFAIMKGNALIGRVLDNRFEVLELLGEGGMGQVYRAHQLSMKRDIALKILPLDMASDKEAVRRFLKEAQAVSRINHPNAITVYDFGQTKDGILYLAMEYIRGRTLSDMITSQGSLAFDDACKILTQVCNALEEAHTLGIVHRDLKPDNIMVLEKAGHDNLIKVLDFGLAKIRFGDSTVEQTKTGLICGTPHYMSPEQVMGERVDERADIYAAGIILYELCTGQPPFDADSPMAIAMKHLKNDPPPIRKNASRVMVPLELQMLILKCLKKQREERPSSARELREELRQILKRSSHQHSVELPPIETGISQVMNRGQLGTGQRQVDSMSDTMAFDEVSEELKRERQQAGVSGGLTNSMLSSVGKRSVFASWKFIVPALIAVICVTLLLINPWSSKERSQKVEEQTTTEDPNKLKTTVVKPVPKQAPKPKPDPKKPPVVAKKPPVVAKKPPVVAKKPPVVAKKPPVVAKKPPLVTKKPLNKLGDYKKGDPGVKKRNPVVNKGIDKPLARVKLKLVSVPRGASVSINGVSRGRTPRTISMTPSKKKLKVRFSKRGYTTRTVTIVADKDRTFSYSLTKKQRKIKRKTGDRIFSP